MERVHELLQGGEHCVLVTIAGVRGSAPREIGAKMIVTAQQTEGSIGGGRLEYECTRMAVAHLHRPQQKIFERKFPLGANLGQCCGGVVQVLFEYLDAGSARWPGELLRLYREREPLLMVTGCSGVKLLLTGRDCHVFDDQPGCAGDIAAIVRPLLARRQPATRLDTANAGHLLLEPVMGSDFNIAIFGAGHVGAACVASLAQLDSNIRWIDNRRDVFPERLPGNVFCVSSADPKREVGALPGGSFYLVMTHSHPLDYEICGTVLGRPDFAYCGLIGSRSKRRRFEKLMRSEGMPASLYRQLTCPIGVAGIAGKTPAEIAIAVSAELLQLRDAATSGASLPADLRLLSF